MMIMFQLLALGEYGGKLLHNLAMFNLLGGFNAMSYFWGCVVHLIGGFSLLDVSDFHRSSGRLETSVDTFYVKFNAIIYTTSAILYMRTDESSLALISVRFLRRWPVRDR